MKNIERIKKWYDIKLLKNGFLAIKPKRESNFKIVCPSQKLRLYFMFDNEFNKETVGELIRGRKAIKVTAIEFYREFLEESEFNICLNKYFDYKQKLSEY